MKKIIPQARIALVFTEIMFAFMFAFSLPVLAFADQLDTQTSQPVDLVAPAVDPVLVPSETTILTDNEVPLSNKPYEYGWALFNLLATGLTTVIAVFLAALLIVRKIKAQSLSNNLGLAAFAAIAAILSIVLLAGTEPLNAPNAKMIMVDSYSLAHVAVLVVAILCAVLSVVRDVKTLIAK